MTRLARELGYDGYDGYDAFRGDVQASLRSARWVYAQALHQRPEADLFAEVLTTSRENAASVFAPEVLDVIQSCIVPIPGARAVAIPSRITCLMSAEWHLIILLACPVNRAVLWTSWPHVAPTISLWLFRIITMPQ